MRFTAIGPLSGEASRPIGQDDRLRSGEGDMSGYWRLANYEDVNDVERPRRSPRDRAGSRVYERDVAVRNRDAEFEREPEHRRRLT